MTPQLRVAVFLVWYIATLGPALVIVACAHTRHVQWWSYLFDAGAVAACIWILWSY